MPSTCSLTVLRYWLVWWPLWYPDGRQMNDSLMGIIVYLNGVPVQSIINNTYNNPCVDYVCSINYILVLYQCA